MKINSLPVRRKPCGWPRRLPSELGHGYVGTEHLLLGLMREEEGIAHRVLEEAGLTDDMICDVLASQRGHRAVRRGTLPRG